MSDKIQSSGLTLTQQSSEDMLFVEGYGGGGFRLMGRRVEGGIIVLPTGFYPIEAMALADLGDTDFKAVLDAEDRPELILIGTGPAMQLLPKALRESLEGTGLGYDVMDTGAAARTYNVLLMEGRRAAALLLPVD